MEFQITCVLLAMLVDWRKPILEHRIEPDRTAGRRRIDCAFLRRAARSSDVFGSHRRRTIFFFANTSDPLTLPSRFQCLSPCLFLPSHLHAMHAHTSPADQQSLAHQQQHINRGRRRFTQIYKFTIYTQSAVYAIYIYECERTHEIHNKRPYESNRTYIRNPKQINKALISINASSLVERAALNAMKMNSTYNYARGSEIKWIVEDVLLGYIQQHLGVFERVLKWKSIAAYTKG